MDGERSLLPPWCWYHAGGWERPYFTVAEVYDAEGSIMAKGKTSTIGIGSEGKDNGQQKRVSPVTKAEFAQNAKAIGIKIGDTLLAAEPKMFSTGSFGWYLNGKVTVMVGDIPTTVQIGLNMTVVGSRPV